MRSRGSERGRVGTRAVTQSFLRLAFVIHSDVKRPTHLVNTVCSPVPLELPLEPQQEGVNEWDECKEWFRSFRSGRRIFCGSRSWQDVVVLPASVDDQLSTHCTDRGEGSQEFEREEINESGLELRNFRILERIERFSERSWPTQRFEFRQQPRREDLDERVPDRVGHPDEVSRQPDHSVSLSRILSPSFELARLAVHEFDKVYETDVGSERLREGI